MRLCKINSFYFILIPIFPTEVWVEQEMGKEKTIGNVHVRKCGNVPYAEMCKVVGKLDYHGPRRNVLPSVTYVIKIRIVLRNARWLLFGKHDGKTAKNSLARVLRIDLL